MTESNHLCDLWEHTITKVSKHDSKSELALMLKQWIIFNKLENFNSIMNYIIDDFPPSGSLSYLNQHGDILHQIPLKEVFNLYRYMQHLILKSELDYDDEEFDNHLDEGNWLLQTRGKYMKFVIYHSSTGTEPRNTSN